MKRITRLSLVFVILASISCAGKKVDPTPSNPLDTLARQTKIIIDGINVGTKTVINLQREGAITVEQERSALLILRKANTYAGELRDRQQNLDLLNSDAKRQLLTVIDELVGVLQENTNLFGIKNPETAKIVSGILTSIQLALVIIRNTLGG